MLRALQTKMIVHKANALLAELSSKSEISAHYVPVKVEQTATEAVNGDMAFAGGRRRMRRTRLAATAGSPMRSGWF